jgi:hypothetical protein
VKVAGFLIVSASTLVKSVVVQQQFMLLQHQRQLAVFMRTGTAHASAQVNGD